MGKKLSIIIPVYNEEKTLSEIVKRVKSVVFDGGITKEIIIVNDASVDGTRKIADSMQKDCVVIHHEKNSGKGSSVIDGLKASTGDFVVIQDADLEYDPVEINLLLGPILKGDADVVYGSRLATTRPHRIMYFWHYAGNKFLTTFSNIFTNLNLTDMETCYKMLTRRVVDDIKNKLVSKRFGIEPEITARIKKYRIFEVGISYSGRTYEEGKKINWKDGLATFWHIVRFNLFS